MTTTTFRRGVLGVVLLAALSGMRDAWAQDRLPAIPVERQTEAQRKAALEFRAERQQDVFGPFVPLSRSPQLMLQAARMGTYLRFGNALPRDISEFAILLVARRWTQQYEWALHSGDARKAGVSDEIVQAVADGRRPPGMSAQYEIVYEFSRELSETQGVSDVTYRRMVATFGEQGMMDLIGLHGYYGLLAMVLNVARTPPDAGQAPLLAPFPR